MKMIIYDDSYEYVFPWPEVDKEMIWHQAIIDYDHLGYKVL